MCQYDVSQGLWWIAQTKSTQNGVLANPLAPHGYPRHHLKSMDTMLYHPCMAEIIQTLGNSTAIKCDCERYTKLTLIGSSFPNWSKKPMACPSLIMSPCKRKCPHAKVLRSFVWQNASSYKNKNKSNMQNYHFTAWRLLLSLECCSNSKRSHLDN